MRARWDANEDRLGKGREGVYFSKRSDRTDAMK
jgi:hypothetical protein